MYAADTLANENSESYTHFWQFALKSDYVSEF